MPYFPDELMPLTPKRDAAGSHPGNPVTAARYNRHDEELRAIEEFILGSAGQKEINQRIEDLVRRTNSLLLRGPALVLSGKAVSGTQMRFPRTEVAFLAVGQDGKPVPPARSDATIRVDSTEAFPEEGVISILNDITEGSYEDSAGRPTNVEWIRYRGKTSTSFLNCERGLDFSTIGDHALIHSSRLASCPETPLATVRPICPPSIVIRPYVFDLFGLEGDPEDIENDLAAIGPSIEAQVDHPDYDAFREAMGAVTPDPTVPDADPTVSPATTEDVRAADGPFVETFTIDFDTGQYKLLTRGDPVGTLSELASHLRASDIHYAPSDFGYNMWPFAVTQAPEVLDEVITGGESIWHWAAPGTSVAALYQRKIRKKRRSVARTSWTYDTVWERHFITWSQAWNILNGTFPAAPNPSLGWDGDVQAQLYKFVRPAGLYSVNSGRLKSAITSYQADDKLSPDEARTVMIAAAEAGLIRIREFSEGKAQDGIPVFLGKIDVAHGFGAWSFRDRSAQGVRPSAPRVIQYADGTLFCFLGENDDFQDVGQSDLTYRTWVQPL
jgi:hypothetical protein